MPRNPNPAITPLKSSGCDDSSISIIFPSASNNFRETTLCPKFPFFQESFPCVFPLIIPPIVS